MALLRKARDIAEELRLLGPGGAAYRLAYEAANRSGWRVWRQPVEAPGSGRWRKSWRGHQSPKDLLSFWRMHRPCFFVSPASLPSIGESLRGMLEKTDQENLLARADEACRGRLRCFSRWTGDFGNPVDWHRNPRSGARWPNNVHWSRVLEYETACGDVKLTWEAGRFPHAYDFVRAWALSGDSRWPRAFFDQLQGWEVSNPYRAGVHWASGQEAAIRVCAWIFALYAFGDSPVLEEADMERILRLMYLHAEQIETNLDFAKLAVPNNHLIGEALALFLVGSYFPWFDSSRRWTDLGLELLLKKCTAQFYSDGGYCQSSHTYHRLALHYYLWALRSCECLGRPMPQIVYSLMERSGQYLQAFANKDGRLPNWGANDGALLNPWTECDFNDFRPILSAVSFLGRGRRSFPPGPWDEELVWLWGPDGLKAPEEPIPRRSASFAESGLHVLRQGAGDFVVLRCGELRDRFGQADQLHVDLWWRGQNVAQDGGSYLYNDEIQFHRHFMGTASHNTVTVDGHDQMQLHRRFKWLYGAPARLTCFEPNGTPPSVGGFHEGFRRLRNGVRHRRTVRVPEMGRVEIIDTLEPYDGAAHVYTLHWLLGPWPIERREESAVWAVRIRTPAGPYVLRFSAWSQSPERPLGGDLRISWGGDDPVDGWVSRYYGEKAPAPSTHLVVRAKGIVRFLTEGLPVEGEVCAHTIKRE